MKRVFLTLACLAFSGAILLGANQAEQLQKATNVLNEIMQTPDKGIPSNLLNKAVCVGIVPSELKLAFGVGGNYGRGVLVCRKGGNGPWGAPSLFTLGGGSFGFQLGGQATDVVFLVMNPSGINKLVQDSIKLGAGMSVAAGPVGRSAEGSTDAELHAEILSYSRSRGLFAGISLSGAVLKQDRGGNEKLYGQPVTAKQILIEGAVSSPADADELDRTLAKYSPTGGEPFAAVTTTHASGS